jgi:hypothetical protein
MIDRAVTILGLGITLILGLYTFAPPDWPKVPPLITLSGMAIGILILGIGIGLVVGHYGRKSPLVIEYHWNDPRFVEPVPKVTGGVGASRYYVVVFNRSKTRTIEDVTVEWDPTPLTRFIDQQMGRHGLVLVPNMLHPLERRFVYLLGLDDNTTTIQKWDDVLGHTSSFVVRARGRNAAEVSQAFEYSPIHFPKVLRT